MSDANAQPSPAAKPVAERVCVGQFAGAHGVRGLARLRPFTEAAEDAVAYGPVDDERGRSYRLTLRGQTKDALIVAVEGLTDRDAVQALAGVKLFVPRDRLPPIAEEETWYHADLLGCVAVDPDGVSLGVVRAVHDFGAGDMLEIAAADGTSRFLPFTKACAPRIDVAARRIDVVLPAETEVKPDGAAEDEGDAA